MVEEESYIVEHKGPGLNTKFVKKGEKPSVFSLKECEYEANQEHNWYKEDDGPNNMRVLCTRNCLGIADTHSHFEQWASVLCTTPRVCFLLCS